MLQFALCMMLRYPEVDLENDREVSVFLVRTAGPLLHSASSLLSLVIKPVCSYFLPSL